MKTACFILGMHRSGTSALGGVLSILGMEFGSDLMSANEGNPKGYFENNFIYKLNEKILLECNSSWYDLYFDANMIKQSDFEVYVSQAEEILINEFRYVEKFVIKDPRISLLFPIWEKACKNLGYDIKIILPYRNPLEVAKSLQKRNNFSIEKGLLLWSKHVLEAEKFSRNYKHISTTFSELIDEPIKTMKVLADFLDIDISKNTKKDVISFLDKKIKHNNISLQNVSQELPIFLSKLIKLIKKEDFDNTDKFDKLRKEFYFSLSLFHNNDIKQQFIKNKFLEKKVQKLEKIKDITLFDEDFYKAEYVDLQKYSGQLIEHYIQYGNKEGRYPNEYTKVNSIDVRGSLPTDICLKQTMDKLNDKEKKLLELSDKLNYIKEKNNVLSKQVNEQQKLVRELEKAKQEILETKTKEIELLSSQNDKLTNAYKLEHQKVQKLIQDIQESKESIIQQQKYIEELERTKQEILETKTKEIELLSSQNDKLTNTYQLEHQKVQKLTQNIQESKESIIQQQKRIEELERTKQEILETKTKEIELLSSQKNNMEQLYSLESKKVKKLTAQIDEIVEDLSTIKESKCWIYTKPLRDLHKSMKG